MTEPAGTPSPLAEASPESLDEFFSRNPADLSDDDLRRMIAQFRRQRELWLAAEAAGAKRAPSAAKAPKAKAPATKLDDLGLDDII